MGRVTDRRRVLRVRGTRTGRLSDTLVVEEPMELRVNGEPLTVTMRTPGSDFDLAAGFLVGEGVVGQTGDITEIRYCDGVDADGRNTYNVVDVTLADHIPSPADRTRRVTTTSACGVCGRTSLDAVHLAVRHPVAEDPAILDLDVLRSLPDRLRTQQKVFDRTGGLHAAGLFTPHGEPITVQEDVGRHNAVDKVVGDALRDGRLPLTGTVLTVSGRASFELVQKALLAGIPVLVAVSAPSTLAVDLAEAHGLTLAGFVRGDSLNVYTRPDRIAGLA